VALLRSVRPTRNRPNRQSLDEWQRRAATTLEQRHRGEPLRIQHFDQRGKPITQHPAAHRPAGMRYQISGHLGKVLSVS
jgi:hypothetical protein